MSPDVSLFANFMKHISAVRFHELKKAQLWSEALALRHGIERNTRPPAKEEAIEPGAVRAQLDRILASKTFSRSPRISRFLTFVVEQTLAGQEDKLKEYLLGVEVFNRMDSFDRVSILSSGSKRDGSATSWSAITSRKGRATLSSFSSERAAMSLPFQTGTRFPMIWRLRRSTSRTSTSSAISRRSAVCAGSHDLTGGLRRESRKRSRASLRHSTKIRIAWAPTRGSPLPGFSPACSGSCLRVTLCPRRGSVPSRR